MPLGPAEDKSYPYFYKEQPGACSDLLEVTVRKAGVWDVETYCLCASFDPDSFGDPSTEVTIPSF